MPALVRVFAAALALLLPMTAPLLRGLRDLGAAYCCTGGACGCPKPSLPTHDQPCHGRGPSSSPVALRCHHPGPDLQVPSVGAFIPESTVSLAALAQPQAAPALREEPRPGFRRIESPPPRPASLAS